MTSTAHDLAHRLQAAVDRALPELRGFSESRTSIRPSAARWCAREELGHLIDSAYNNHRRVVIGRSSGTLVFDGYDQDAWVDAHGYAEMSWNEIVDLWLRTNRHLARAVARVPDDVILRAHSNHNLDRVGFRDYAPGASASLGDLIADYIDHLEHHLRSIRVSVAV